MKRVVLSLLAALLLSVSAFSQELIKQSTAYNAVVFATDSTDHITGKTGLTFTITASKDGAAFASITPTVTELANGWYKFALTTSHTDTVGALAIHATATGADPVDMKFQVRPNVLGDTLPSNVTQFGGSAGTFASGIPAVNTTKVGGTTQTAGDIGSLVPSSTDVTSSTAIGCRRRRSSTSS